MVVIVILFCVLFVGQFILASAYGKLSRQAAEMGNLLSEKSDLLSDTAKLRAVKLKAAIDAQGRALGRALTELRDHKRVGHRIMPTFQEFRGIKELDDLASSRRLEIASLKAEARELRELTTSKELEIIKLKEELCEVTENYAAETSEAASLRRRVAALIKEVERRA